MRTYNIEPAGVTDVGNVRTTNEDHLLAEGDLFVVADGMGGEGGEIASRLAVEVLRDSFTAEPSTDGLVKAVRDANQAVLARSADLPGVERLGTTLAAVGLITEDDDVDRLVVINVGDSRVYLLRGGNLRRLSSDHSKVADLVRAGRLSEEEAAQHPERHILTQAVGVGPDVAPHLDVIEPEPGDRLLLCSDGLFNEVPAAELLDILVDTSDAEAAVERLVTGAKEHGGSDNITAVVVDIN